jgi:hypothetical protein
MCILRIRVIGEIIQGPSVQRIETCHICIQRIDCSGDFCSLVVRISTRDNYLGEKIAERTALRSAVVTVHFVFVLVSVAAAVGSAATSISGARL